MTTKLKQLLKEDVNCLAKYEEEISNAVKKWLTQKREELRADNAFYNGRTIDTLDELLKELKQ